MFTIDTDNNITACAAAEQITEGQEQFATEKELAKLTTAWPADRLVEVWNSFAGVAGFGCDLKPVKKFTNRKVAVARIWKAIQKLNAPAAPQAADAAPKAAAATTRATHKDAAPQAKRGARKAKTSKPTKAAKPATTVKPATEARDGSKKSIILDLLRRPKGATMAEIMAATDWQAHSVRGFISGTLGKKMGLAVESTKSKDGDRTYQITK